MAIALQVWNAITQEAPETHVPSFSGRQALLPPLCSSKQIYGRIQAADVCEAVKWVSNGQPGSHNMKAFLCGPPSFADDCADHLRACGLSSEQIMYERWW